MKFLSLPKYSLLIIAIIILSGMASGWEHSAISPEKILIDKIDDIVEDEMIKQNIVGMAVGVVRNGKIIHVKGYGYTHLTNQTPVTTKTPFRWASISKTLTAVATLQLDERDPNFSINDRVTKHVNYWATDLSKMKKQVTVTHLLSNRSGIQHYGKGRKDKGNTYKYYSNRYKPDNTGYNGKKAVAVFADANLDFAPGTKYLYSTFGFNLLGAVLDEAARGGYVNYVKNSIANKMGMTSLKVSDGSFRGYQKNCDGELNGKSIGSVEWKLPGGGWESNIQDLARFAMGIMNGDLLKNNSRLWTPISNNNNYCYGVYRGGSGNDLRIAHSGAHDNVRTYMHLYPKQQYGVVLMSNCEFTSVSRIAERIHKLYGKSWDPDISPLDTCRNGKSCNGSFAGVWRKTGQDVILRRGYSHKNFFEEWKRLGKAGYYCDDFEAYDDKGTLRWDGVFRKGSKQMAIWRNFDTDGFGDKWREQSGNGYRLVDLETYMDGGKRKWAGLFEKRGGSYALFRNLDHDAFNAKWKEMSQKGNKLIDIEVYQKSGKLYWSGVWIEGKDGLLNRNYSTGDFNALWKKRKNAGYKLIDLEAYKVGSSLKWAGVWEKSNQGEALYRGFNYCGLMDKHQDLSKKGYELVDLERY